MFSLKCVCVRVRARVCVYKMRGILTLILQPSQLVFYFSPEKFHWLSVGAMWGGWNNLSCMPHFVCTCGTSVPLEGWVMGAEVGQRWAAQTSIQLPTKHPCRSRFGLAPAVQSYLNLQKPWGNFRLITRNVGVRLILYAHFCFPKHSCWEAMQIGGIWWVLFPGSRLVSDGLNVRRALRVSIIIKSSFFVCEFRSCCELEDV